MTQTLPLLKFATKNSTTKENIILLLSQMWPLNVKEIFNEVQKNGSNNVTYQAVHKTISLLEGEKIIEKTGKKYKLNNEWISKLKKFSAELVENYSEKNKKYLQNNEREVTTKLFFDDLSEFTVEMAKLLANGTFVGQGGTVGIGLLRHAWWPLKFKFIDFNLVIDVMKNNNGGFVVIEHETPFDKWIARQYQSANFSGVKTGVKNLNLTNDIVIHGDSIIQVSYSEETKKFQDEIYSKSSNLGDLFKEFFNQSITKHKEEIEVTITKNPQLAKTMKDQLIEKYFGDKK